MAEFCTHHLLHWNAETLKRWGYLSRLDNRKCHYIIRPLNRLAERLAGSIAELGGLTDNDYPGDARILATIISLHFANAALPPRKR